VSPAGPSATRGSVGRVILVGAGPGDPDLLTVRAVRALEAADLVLYDALVDPRVLALAPRAGRFCVGKRAGRDSVAQSTILRLLLRFARRGKTVVRLKSGDPFVLGRGGEEVLACGAAGVPVEVVPGLTSAIAGPGAAGIPVTHRGLASGFLVLSAVPKEHCERVLRTISPEDVTVVLLMALGARASIASFVRSLGWPRDLPAAVVVGACTPEAWTWTGTIETLDQPSVPVRCRDLPGLVVLGRVVALRDAVSQAMSKLEESEPPWRRMQRR
jgi:uroporphyrin-III C-methyltransferase